MSIQLWFDLMCTDTFDNDTLCHLGYVCTYTVADGIPYVHDEIAKYLQAVSLSLLSAVEMSAPVWRSWSLLAQESV